MTTTITQEDIDKANKAFAAKNSLCTTCVVFQAFTRNNIPVAECFLSNALLNSGEQVELDLTAQEITHLDRHNWQSALGKTITLPDL